VGAGTGMVEAGGNVRVEPESRGAVGIERYNNIKHDG